MTGVLPPAWNKHLNNIWTLAQWRCQRAWDHLENIFWSTSKTSKYLERETDSVPLCSTHSDFFTQHHVTVTSFILSQVRITHADVPHHSAAEAQRWEPESWSLMPLLCSWAFMSVTLFWPLNLSAADKDEPISID